MHYIKYVLFLVVMISTVPSQAVAAEKMSVQIVSPNGGEVFQKGKKMIVKILATNIPKAGASLSLQEVYDEHGSDFTTHFVTGADQFFKHGSSTLVDIPVEIELSSVNTSMRLFATLREGYSSDGSVKNQMIARDSSDGRYIIIDQRPAGLPDFSIAKIEYVNPKGLKPNAVAKVRVTVKNNSLHVVRQKLEIATSAAGQAVTDPLKIKGFDAPGPGELKTYTVTGKVNSSTGKNDEFLGLYVSLDPRDLIVESDEHNTDFKRVRTDTFGF